MNLSPFNISYLNIAIKVEINTKADEIEAVYAFIIKSYIVHSKDCIRFSFLIAFILLQTTIKAYVIPQHIVIRLYMLLYVNIPPIKVTPINITVKYFGTFKFFLVYI